MYIPSPFAFVWLFARTSLCLDDTPAAGCLFSQNHDIVVAHSECVCVMRVELLVEQRFKKKRRMMHLFWESHIPGWNTCYWKTLEFNPIHGLLMPWDLSSSPSPFLFGFKPKIIARRFNFSIVPSDECCSGLKTEHTQHIILLCTQDRGKTRLDSPSQNHTLKAISMHAISSGALGWRGVIQWGLTGFRPSRWRSPPTNSRAGQLVLSISLSTF